MLLSILAISRNATQLSMLLAALPAGDIPSSTEVLVSWNGNAKERQRIIVPNGLNIEILDRSPYSFAENNNYLASKAQGEYLLFINDDVIPDKGAIGYAFTAIQKKYVGIVGANLRYPNGKLQHAGVFFDEDGKPYHRHKHQIFWTDPQVRADMFVPAVTGAFIMVRKDEFDTLKFDETFEVAGEDIVFCLQYRNQYRREILYSANVTAIHIENATRKLTKTRLTPTADLSRIIKNANHSHNGQLLSEVRRPKVRIVTEQPGWIMHRMASEIQKYLGNNNVRINEDWEHADIHYYINYGKFSRRPQTGLVVANFTHYDPDTLSDRFIEVANEVDYCICISEKTADDLRHFGAEDKKISVIVIGADETFKPKLTLGIVGRVYKGGRKGEDIVDALAQDPDVMRHVRIVATNDDWNVNVWKFDELGDFYRSIDYLLVPSRLEGGPVPFMEALACGTLSIAPPLGVIPQFPHIPYTTGDIDQLKQVVKRLAKEHIAQRAHFSNHMSGLDWSGWAIKHEKLFRKLIWAKENTLYHPQNPANDLQTEPMD